MYKNKIFLLALMFMVITCSTTQLSVNINTPEGVKTEISIDTLKNNKPILKRPKTDEKKTKDNRKWYIIGTAVVLSVLTILIDSK